MTEPASSASPERKPLKERILRAGSWTVFAYGCTLVLRLASSLIMTRLLAPDAFENGKAALERAQSRRTHAQVCSESA